jgi:hypothetical protein
VVAESALVRHQLLVLNRGRQACAKPVGQTVTRCIPQPWPAVTAEISQNINSSRTPEPVGRTGAIFASLLVAKKRRITSASASGSTGFAM